MLTATATTVGDVRDAGADLAEPRGDALGDAEAAVAAQQEVVAAEQELTEAEATLAAAKQDSSQKSSTPSARASSGSPSLTALVPTKTVNRVKQADADFTAVQEGISPESPIAEASQQFNAAAVALEMSWLRMLADAGCLTDEQQKQAEAAVRDYAVALQKSLADAGYYEGEVDGVYGPATVDGQGPVDGEWTVALTEAVKAFQTDLGVKPTGEVDAARLPLSSRRSPTPNGRRHPRTRRPRARHQPLHRRWSRPRHRRERAQAVRDQERHPMATFTVWRFDEPGGAFNAERLLLDAEKEGMVTVVDRAVVSWPAGAKRPTTRHSEDDELGREAGWGALWGLLFGALFFMPLLGAAAGAGLGALHQVLERVGITKEQMDTLRWQITEGTSALFVVTEGADLDRLGERLRGTSWVLIDSDLTDVEQARLLGALRG